MTNIFIACPQGGLCCSQGGSHVCVRVVEEGRLSASCPHLGLPLVSQYRGRILRPGEVRGDDGSSPQAWQEDGRGEGQLYLTQVDHTPTASYLDFGGPHLLYSQVL